MKTHILSCIFVVCLLLFLFHGEMVFSYAYKWTTKQLSNEGLTVLYYKGRNFDTIRWVATEHRAYRDYGTNRPVWSVPPDNFSSRWLGFLIVPEDGAYRFVLQARGGSRLLIDDKTVIDQWHANRWTYAKLTAIALTKGKHKICIEYVHRIGNAGIMLRWNGGPIPKNSGKVLSVPFIVKK